MTIHLVRSNPHTTNKQFPNFMLTWTHNIDYEVNHVIYLTLTGTNNIISFSCWLGLTTLIMISQHHQYCILTWPHNIDIDVMWYILYWLGLTTSPVFISCCLELIYCLSTTYPLLSLGVDNHQPNLREWLAKRYCLRLAIISLKC